MWRPLTTPYQDRPLALLDNRSLCAKDLVPADVLFPHHCDEGYEVLYSPDHRWFYKQGMDSEEVLMFKLYDSSSEHVRCEKLHFITVTSRLPCITVCPHSAFVDPSVPADTPPRASVEFRAILID